MRVSLTRFIVSAAVVCAASMSARGLDRPAPTEAPLFSNGTDLLDRYERGEYDKVSSTLKKLNEYSAYDLLVDLYKNSAVWIAAKGPDAVPRRERVLAAVALESAAARNSTARQFTELGCETLRASKAPPGEIDRLWMLASIALAESAQDWVFLNGAPVGPGGSFVGTWIPYDTGEIQLGHLDHVEARIPKDAHAKLARGVGIEFDARTVLDPRRQSNVSTDLIEAEMINTADRRSAARVAAVRRAIAVFEPLVKDADAGPEAQMRLGYSQLRIGETKQALVNLQQASERSTDPWVRHIASLVRGWTLVREGQHAEAFDAYRASLTDVPQARTAVTLFVAALIHEGRAADAQQVSDAFLHATKRPDDPWLDYFEPDARNYDAWIEQLRDALRK